MTPAGIASPHTKSGRYSKYLPMALQARYEAAVHDPNLLILRDEVALVDTRMGALLEKTSPDAPPDQAEWREIFTLLGQRRRLVESERKRLSDLHQMLTATEAATLVVRLAAIVREHVQDRRALNAISLEFAAVLHQQGRLEPGG